MSYRGMGQSVAVSAPVPAPNWAGIARFARNAAGGVAEGVVAVFSAASRSNRQARHTASLRALADTTAVRPLAVFWLGQPARRHREGLLAIASWADRNAANQRTSGTAAAARPAAPPSGNQRTSGTASSRNLNTEDFLAALRAELQKPRQQWHPDLVKVVSMVESSKASPQAGVEMMKRLMDSATGDTRLVLGVMVVGTEDMLRAMASMQSMAAQASPSSSQSSEGSSSPAPMPQPVPVGNYSY